MFGSIIALQILAHYPLANIELPANARTCFDIMVTVVSFDYFPITEVIDFNFTPTEPWSTSFEYLDYGSVNFLEGMGSIALFIWIGALYVLLVITIYFCKITCYLKSLNTMLKPMNAWYTSLGFI